MEGSALNSQVSYQQGLIRDRIETADRVALIRCGFVYEHPFTLGTECFDE